MQTLIHTLAFALLELTTAIGLLVAGRLVLRPIGSRLSPRQLDLYYRLVAMLIVGTTLIIVYTA
jgi:hypothetical protein